MLTDLQKAPRGFRTQDLRIKSLARDSILSPPDYGKMTCYVLVMHLLCTGQRFRAYSAQFFQVRVELAHSPVEPVHKAWSAQRASSSRQGHKLAIGLTALVAPVSEELFAYALRLISIAPGGDADNSNYERFNNLNE